MSKPQVVLASANPGKLAEFQEMFRSLGMTVIPQSEFNLGSVAETGLSFVENAIIKARHACAATGLPAIADDSGIEVDALNGAPGIYSARFSGEHATDESNNAKLLEDLSMVPDNRRTARYQCILVYMRHAQDPTPVIAEGHWEGSILRSPRGAGGFGYDPLFWVPSHNCTSAELDTSEKNRVSHRAMAMKALFVRLHDTSKFVH